MPTDNQQVSAATSGFGVAAAVAIICNSILTVIKDKNPAVNAWMKQVLYHHWIAHGVAIVGLFLLLGIVLTLTAKKMSGKSVAWLLVASSVLGALGLIGLFLFA